MTSTEVTSAGLDLRGGDPGGVQFALQVFPVQGGALRHGGLLLFLCRVFQVQPLGDRNVLPVPALPVPGLVAAEQQQRRPGGIEREEHPDLGPASGAGPQLLEVMDPAALDPVHQRPAERGSFLPQSRDRLGDLGVGGQVVLDQGGEPRGVLLGDLDALRHTAASLFKARLNSRDALTLCLR